jgi:hypothetical protein
MDVLLSRLRLRPAWQSENDASKSIVGSTEKGKMMLRWIRNFKNWGRSPVQHAPVKTEHRNLYAEGDLRFRILGDFSKLSAIQELHTNLGKTFMLVSISSRDAQNEAILEFAPVAASLVIANAPRLEV